MDTGAMTTDAPDLGSCFDGAYLDTVFSSYCEPTLGKGPTCDDSSFSCCTSNWDYSSTVESCISVHATVSCDDYGFPTKDGRASGISDCSTNAALFAAQTTGPADTVPSTTTDAPTGAGPKTSVPVATSGSAKPLVSSGGSIVVTPSSVSKNGTLASTVGKSSVATSAVVVKTTTGSAGATTTSAAGGKSSSGSGTGTSASAAATTTTTTKSAASGLEVRTSAAVGLFAMVVLVVFRAGL